ncbi:hypothetical protein BS17DRAFT_772732 [Gyrodon lividus]|nr:hypothetical protein BS17DRAFT_772732 [Gyrodon lividus]
MGGRCQEGKSNVIGFFAGMLPIKTVIDETREFTEYEDSVSQGKSSRQSTLARHSRCRRGGRRKEAHRGLANVRIALNHMYLKALYICQVLMAVPSPRRSSENPTARASTRSSRARTRR